MTTRSLDQTVIKKTLPNGLTVLIREDHGSPIVALNVWFGVGSVNETEEINGLAHFQEHMVFKGTETYGVGEIANLVKAAGGNLNAGTSFSYTMYHIVLPSHAFATALEVQADAMMHSTFDPEEFRKERLVVIDEARMYDDRPESFVFYRTMELGFDKHTYRRPIVGYQHIVEKIERDQLLEFYSNYYRPSNAVLVAVGDIDPEDALRRIESAYGGWESRDVYVYEPPVEPPQATFRAQSYAGTIDHGYLGAGFHVPNILHDDYPALEMLSELLSSGRSSRLYRRVLEEKRLVTSISASMLAERWPGCFLVMASMPPEKFSDAHDATFAEIERMKHEPVEPDEIEKARRQIERDMYHELETVEGQASSLGYYQLLGDYRLADRHRTAISRVTPDQVMEVARRYFHPGNMSLVSYLPGEDGQEDTPLNALRAKAEAVLSSDGGVNDMSASPDPATVAVPADSPGVAVARPRAVDESAVTLVELDNGVRVLVKRRPSVPLVSILTTFQGGGRFEPRGKSGVAMLTHRAWPKETASYGADELSDRIESLGGSIDSYASFDTGGVYLSGLSEHLQEALPLYREVLRTPRFEADRIRKEKQKLLEELSRRHDNPIQLTMDSMFGNTFGEHPYAHPFLGKRQEVTELGADDCSNWYRSLLSPANLVVTFVGDIDAERACSVAEDLFGDLGGLPVRTPEFAPPQLPVNPGEHVIRKKDLKQAVVFVGFTSAPMMTEDSVALQVLNGVLTGLGGRLFVELRDKRSLGYMTGSSLNPLFDRSLFFGYANPNVDGIGEAVRVILHELDLVTRELVSQEEFLRSREWLIGSQAMQLQTNSAQASAYGTYEALGFGYGAVDRATERIRGVTREAMLDVAKRVFRPETAVIVKLIPED